MSLYDKIEEIRQKPEHIRIRYVWVCVIICMVFVLGVWALSLKSRSYQAEIPGQVAGQVSIFDELKKQKESLSQYQQEVSSVGSTLQQGLQEVQKQQSVQNNPNISSQEGFSGGNAQNTLPTSDSTSLFQ